MERKKRWHKPTLLLALLTILATLAATGPTLAGPTQKRSAERAITSAGAQEEEEEENESDHLLARMELEMARTVAPGTNVSGEAFDAAQAQAASLPVAGGRWSMVSNKPTQNDARNFRDPVWSNSGAGWFLIAGRISSLVASNGVLYAGAADGGVWKSTDRGTTWTLHSHGLPRFSIGSLAVNPADQSIWVGLGEATTAFENIKAEGVFRLEAGGDDWNRVGGQELDSNFVYEVHFDEGGNVYAATNSGLYKRSASASLDTPWTLVLKPDPNPQTSPYRSSHITDVVDQGGTHGQVVLAVLGWRGGTTSADLEYNGFYVSREGGAPGTWEKIRPDGDINFRDIGRTTFDRLRGGTAIYAVIESPRRLSFPDVLTGGSNLLGVFVSKSGDPRGPWEQIASPKKLARSGSALPAFGAFPGIQTWYDQYVEIDPVDEKHVYVGLEEIFESTNGGRDWNTIGPYWNFTLPCYQGGLHDCPNTTHPDQHAMTFSKGMVFAGGDGGIWRRTTSNHEVEGWENLNTTLRTLQVYGAGAGTVNSGLAYWAGTQDNGTFLNRQNLEQQVIPQGGDGGMVMVDPNDGNKAVVEYVFLDMAKTLDGGHNFVEISPSCGAFTYTPEPCDFAPQFIAPFEADVVNPDHWVAGGYFVWESHEGWGTECSSDACDWKIVHETGHSTTDLAAHGETIYAGWCGPCNPAGSAPFDSGIDTNFGGEWHTINAPNLPDRYVTELTVDPADPGHVYATFGAFSRRWIPGGGVGHVFESHDGGANWTDISGNLPDYPAEDVILWDGMLAVATHIGVFVTSQSSPGSWAQLGENLPPVAVWDLTLEPGGARLVAGTHGRGLWAIAKP